MFTTLKFFGFIRISAIAIMFSISIALFPGCEGTGMMVKSLLSNPKSLNQLSMAFSSRGAPSDPVDRWLYFAVITSKMSEYLDSELKMLLIDLNSEASIKNSVETQEGVDAILGQVTSVDVEDLTQQQVSLWQKNFPKIIELNLISAGVALSITNLMQTSGSALKAVGADDLGKIKAAFGSLQTVYKFVGPNTENWGKINAYSNKMRETGKIKEPTSNELAKAKRLAMEDGFGDENIVMN